MCLIIFAHRTSPERPLVVAANRDEFHGRPTAAARFWPKHPELLAGQDLEQGGTWMGITRSGRFAAVTNFRDPSRTAPAPRSRGELTVNYLAGEDSPGNHLQRIAEVADQYAGFNLLLGDRECLWYFSNSEAPDKRQPRELPPGIYGLSNASLDTPWPKVEIGKKTLARTITGPFDHDELSVAVSNQQLASLTELSTQGLNGDMDQLLSAQFITNEQYGTRATTTLWVDESGGQHWKEISFGQHGRESGVVELVVS